jgi:hypothetical protein
MVGGTKPEDMIRLTSTKHISAKIQDTVLVEQEGKCGICTIPGLFAPPNPLPFRVMMRDAHRNQSLAFSKYCKKTKQVLPYGNLIAVCVPCYEGAKSRKTLSVKVNTQEFERYKKWYEDNRINRFQTKEFSTTYFLRLAINNLLESTFFEEHWLQEEQTNYARNKSEQASFKKLETLYNERKDDYDFETKVKRFFEKYDLQKDMGGGGHIGDCLTNEKIRAKYPTNSVMADLAIGCRNEKYREMMRDRTSGWKIYADFYRDNNISPVEKIKRISYELMFSDYRSVNNGRIIIKRLRRSNKTNLENWHQNLTKYMFKDPFIQKDQNPSM